MDQLSDPYMTTGKTVALTIQTFVGKVMSLLFKFPMKVYRSFSSKEQASFNFMAAVTICSDFGAQDNASTFSASICHEVMGLDAMILLYFPNSIIW